MFLFDQYLHSVFSFDFCAAAKPNSKMVFVSKEMNEILQEQLKCYICNAKPQVGKYHWYKCLSAHHVCYHCKEKKEFKKCACWQLISHGYCKTIEALLKTEAMQFHCSNQGFGCQAFLHGYAMTQHETECIYRMVNCPRLSCGYKIPFRKVLQHMEENKDLILPVKKDLDYCKISLENYNSGNFTLLPVKFQYEKNVFVCIGKAKDGVFYHWLQMIGSSNEAKNFNYTLEYFGNDASKTNCKFTGQVFSIDERGEELIAKEKCFGMSYGFFKSHFFDWDCTFKYSLKIKDMKKEPKDDTLESGISDDE